MTDRKIIITIPKKPKAKRGGSQIRRGPIINKKKSEYLSRRRVGGGLVNFYDLGQMSDGSGGWVDITFSPLLPYKNVSDPTEGLESLTVADWNILKDAIFSVPSGQWSSKFRKFTYEDAERYSLDLYDVDTAQSYPVGRDGSRIDLFTFTPITGSTWTDQGLDIPATANWQAFSYGAFVPLAKDSSTFGVAPFKITTEPAYDADAVSFDMNLSAGSDVFLVPSILGHHGTGVDLGLNVAEDFQAGYRTLNRSFWFSRNDPDTTYPLLSLSDVSGVNLTDLISHLIPDADLWLSSDGGATYTQQPDATAYPNYNGHLDIPNAQVVVGAFIGAIRSGGTLYYLWSTDQWSVSADRAMSVTP